MGTIENGNSSNPKKFRYMLVDPIHRSGCNVSLLTKISQCHSCNFLRLYDANLPRWRRSARSIAATSGLRP
ncbi:Uncharacterised protein [Vibrio cholerae]|nr:Uncharacterised protein [Vibrio cholerae]CSI66165.1 Uncharacterised protein [Vibrio cholerae]CSI67508.1 Uncharacterised protein [Vibrio cholerae]